MDITPDSDSTPWYTATLDTGAWGIVFTAAFTLWYGSYNHLRGPPTLLLVKERDEDTPITLTVRKAAIIPVIGSGMLLLLYIFFDRIQLMYLLFNAVIAGICLEMAIRPAVGNYLGMCIPKTLRMPFLGHVSSIIFFSSSIAMVVTASWIVSANWILLDFLGIGLCTFILAAVRLPNLRIATILFSGLLCYDIFWVFFSERFFASNVMVNVAEKTAENPIEVVADSLSLPLRRTLPSLSIPAKLMFPSWQREGDFSMLGLGDVVLPGILVAHNLRFDKCARENANAEEGSAISKRPSQYFVITLLGYIFGLCVAILCSERYATAQPALIYLIPSTLGPTLFVGWLRGDLSDLWLGQSLSISHEVDTLIRHTS